MKALQQCLLQLRAARLMPWACHMPLLPVNLAWPAHAPGTCITLLEDTALCLHLGWLQH
jgi:hypothetical protein